MMFGRRWRLFRLLGIPVSLDASWLVILALLTMSLANMFPQLLHRYYPNVGPYASEVFWLAGFVAALCFFGCLLLHELGHAVVARAQRMPIKGITLFLFGGVAEIGDEPPSAKAEFLMAIAGPLVSVALAAILSLLGYVGYQSGWPALLVILLGYLGSINALVLAFNMIPAFPLDGGRVLRSALWAWSGSLRKATFWASSVGRAFSWIFITWGVLNLFAGNWLGGIWIGMIGIFLGNAAQSGYIQVLLRQALEGEPVARFMNRNPITIAPEVTLRHWVDDYVYRYHRKTFPVVDHGHLLGWIETKGLEHVPRSDWDRHTVGEVMRQDLATACISPDEDALHALKQMQTTGFSRLLVTEGDRLVGIISLKDLLQFFNLKLELEGNGDGVSTASRSPFTEALDDDEIEVRS